MHNLQQAVVLTSQPQKACWVVEQLLMSAPALSHMSALQWSRLVNPFPPLGFEARVVC